MLTMAPLSLEVRRHGALHASAHHGAPSPQVRRHGAQRERELRESLASTEARRAELADKLHEVETRHRDAMELQAELKLQMMSEARARQRAEHAAAARAAELADTARTADELHVATAAARAAAVNEIEEGRREAVARQQAAEAQLAELRSMLAAKGDVTPRLAAKGDVTQEALTRTRERAENEADERRRERRRAESELTITQQALERATSASTQAREQLDLEPGTLTLTLARSLI
jgi:hypothetical protein